MSQFVRNQVYFVINPNGSGFNESDIIKYGTIWALAAVINVFKYEDFCQFLFLLM